jgi:hypothetical protein
MKCFISIHGIMNVKRLLPCPLKHSKLCVSVGCTGYLRSSRLSNIALGQVLDG